MSGHRDTSDSHAAEAGEVSDARDSALPPGRPLSPAAERALAEADERRRKAAAAAAQTPPERGGQAGPEPTRYGDWEKGGIVSDF